MKKTLAFVLTLALILSSVITFSVGATLTSVPTETITVDGVVTDNGWAADGWTNVAKDTGWFQFNSIDTDFDYDYQYRIDSTNIYFAFKFNQAPRWTSTTQTGATNLRLWIDSTPADAARTNLFDFTYDKADGATSIIKETKDNGATTGLVYAATEGADYLYIEVSIPLASLGMTSATSVKFLFTGSQDNIYNTAAVVDDPETTEVDETAAAVYKYDALHSLDSTLENKGDYWKDSTPWPAAVTLGDFKLAGSYVNNTAYLKIDSANITHRVDGIVGGTTYRLSANFKGENIAVTGGSAYVNIYFYDENGDFLAFADFAKLVADADWESFTLNKVAPAGASFATMSVGFWNATGITCVDDIMLEAITVDETDGSITVDSVIFLEDWEDGFHACTWGDQPEAATIINPPAYAASTGDVSDLKSVHNIASAYDTIYTDADGKEWKAVYDTDLSKIVFVDPADDTVFLLNGEDKVTSGYYGTSTGAELVDGGGFTNETTGSDSVHFYEENLAFVFDLGEINANLFGFYFGMSGGGWGISYTQSVAVYVSDDGQTWNKVAATVHSGEAVGTGEEDGAWQGYIYGINLDHTVSGRYVKFDVIGSASGHIWASEAEIYANEEPDKLYVNAVLDTNGNGTNYSLAGIYDGSNGGAQRILYYAEEGTYTNTDYLNAAVFAPTNVAGVYTVTDIVCHGDTYDAITVPAGGFVFVSNLGNNWQDLCQAYRDYLAAKEAYDKGDTAEAPTEVAEPWYWGSYKDAPNECTTEGNANYNFVKTLVEGQTARLYNINLELLTCSRDFNSYIAIDFPSVSLAYEYIDGALTLTAIDKDAYQIGAINLALNAPYRFICEVSPSYADTDGKELTDGILAPDGNCGDPAWIGLAGTDNIGNLGRYLSIIDLGETKSVAKLVGYYAHKGWGIGIPATVSFYGSEDGQTFYYIGDVETDTDAIALSDDEWKNYALELELDSTVDVRYVALCTYKGIADGFSFAFVSEFEAYGIEEIPAPIESDPGTPETGDYTPYVIAVLAMILAGSVALVIKKRRA